MKHFFNAILGRPYARLLYMGDRKIITYGLPRGYWQDIYHYAMTASWLVFLLAAASIFMTINIIFAGLYLLEPNAIAHGSPNGFWGAFFFSVETFATVGYGDMHPQTSYAHIIATIETFLGMISVALITGLMFSRFSRPRARIMFVRHPVVGPIEGKQTLMIRAANARQNVIVDASAKLSFVSNEVMLEGMPIRRFKSLTLERDHHPIFLLGWHLMHVVDESSPLFGLSPEHLADKHAELILTIDGVDETTGQSLLSRHHYTHSMIRWQHRYVDLLRRDDVGVYHMDYTKFHDIMPV